MPITPQEALQRTIEHREIFHDEMLHLFRQIMSGEMSPTMIAALTLGLRVKKETIGEIAAAAQVMREFSTKVPMADTTNLLDIVGTGGDGAHTFNISTASMFVAAAAGPQSRGSRSGRGREGADPGTFPRIEAGECCVFSGDTLFEGGPGATRWDYSSFERIIGSIESRLFTLPDETVVHTGHGPSTTVGAERPALGDWIRRGW